MWTDVDEIVADDDKMQTFIPKPFVFEPLISTVTKVYLPGQTYTPFIDGLPIPEVPLCMCVHLCEQFFNYPVTKWGIRCIPSNAKCRFGGRCTGAHLMYDGKQIPKSINMKSQLMCGLTKPQKIK